MTPQFAAGVVIGLGVLVALYAGAKTQGWALMLALVVTYGVLGFLGMLVTGWLVYGEWWPFSHLWWPRW